METAMSPPQSLPTSEIDEVWRYAITAGLVSVAYMAVRYLHSSSGYLDLTPITFVGLLGGFVYGRQAASRQIGLRVGLVGSIALLLPVLDGLQSIAGMTQPTWFRVVGIGVIAAFVGLGIGISVLAGTVGAMLGNWLAKKAGHRPVTLGS